MSEVVLNEDASQTQELKPVRRRRTALALGQVIVLFGGLLLILAIVLPALLAPAMGNVFSNIVANL